MQDYLRTDKLEQTIQFYGHNAGALAQAAQHHLSKPGKRTRSKLLFAATPNPTYSEALVHAAAAVELIHEASIVHDDIQDQTERRRGVPTVWREFGADAALLLGDHLVAAAFRAVAEAPELGLARGPMIVALSESVSRAASGQHLQLTNAAAGAYEAFYTEVATHKTGALIALPLQFAALLNGSDCTTLDSARRCGEQLGLAYQILDDLKPYASPATLANHEDMLNRVITAPVAACGTLHTHLDPFNALVKRADLRNKAVAQCQRWLDSALAAARYEAAFLCKHSAVVVDQFISQQLTRKTSAPLQPTPAYSRWPSRARAEAV